jgi:hypothetical protein
LPPLVRRLFSWANPRTPPCEMSPPDRYGACILQGRVAASTARICTDTVTGMGCERIRRVYRRRAYIGVVHRCHGFTQAFQNDLPHKRSPVRYVRHIYTLEDTADIYIHTGRGATHEAHSNSCPTFDTVSERSTYICTPLPVRYAICIQCAPYREGCLHLHTPPCEIRHMYTVRTLQGGVHIRVRRPLSVCCCAASTVAWAVCYCTVLCCL